MTTLSPTESRAVAAAISRHLHHLRNNRARLVRKFGDQCDLDRLAILDRREQVLVRVLARLDEEHHVPDTV